MINTKLDSDSIREHLKEFYEFKDEYNKRYKNEQRLIDYVYRLSHPSVIPYLHILRGDTDSHILVSDLIYKDAIVDVIGVNNIKISKNSNFSDYSTSVEFEPKKKLKGKPSPPGIRCDLSSTKQLDNFMSKVFGLTRLNQ